MVHICNECPSVQTDQTKEYLRKWRSLEGDWRTFRRAEADNVERGYTTERRNRKSSSGSPMLSGRYGENRYNESTTNSRGSSGYKEGCNADLWCAEEIDYPYEEERSCSTDTSKNSEAAEYSSGFHGSFSLIDRDELRRVVNSSYPLLKENFSLLQKLKKERDVCRQLENDMRDLEGQIQDVSKSFHITEEESREESVKSDGESISDGNIESQTADGSYEEDFTEEQIEDEELDPVTVIESTLSNLMDLAERLEVAVRERDFEVSQLLQGSSIRPGQLMTTDWVRPSSYQLSRIPSELVDLLQNLQAALRVLLSTRDWECSGQHGERDCSSPASFTFQTGCGRVLVPTVRTIFSPVGDSVEMRPIEEPIRDSEEYPSCLSLEEDSGSSSEPSANPAARVITDDSEEPVPETTLSEDHQSSEHQEESSAIFHHNEEFQNGEGFKQDEELAFSKSDCVVGQLQEQSNVFDQLTETPPTLPLIHQPSAEIIKRIERLQELVKPELCESLKLRALRIQKAKEDFLSGVVNSPAIETPSPQLLEMGPTDIIIEDVTVPVPNGLTVKDEVENKKTKFAFLRKKKRQSWCNEELCRESMVLEEKSDWLRNPFRPKGKYKFNK